MTAVLPPISIDRLPPTAAVPDLHPNTALLTVTAHPAPPRAVVVAVRGEADLFTSPLLQHWLLAHLRHAAPLLVIDLTQVDFLGAAGLTVLITVREAAVAAGIRLCLAARTRPVLLPLRITGLDGMFDICPTLAHALQRRGG